MDGQIFLNLRSYIRRVNGCASRTERYSALLDLLGYRCFITRDNLARIMLYKNSPVYPWKYNDTLLRKAR